MSKIVGRGYIGNIPPPTSYSLYSNLYISSSTFSIINRVASSNVTFMMQHHGRPQGPPPPCHCQSLYIDLSRRTNWKSIQSNPFRNIGANTALCRPRKAVIRQTALWESNGRTCELCSLVRAKFANNATSEDLVVILSYSKYIGLHCLSLLNSVEPLRYGSEFNVYALDGKLPCSSISS
jgi:hypothetical protein